MTFEIATFYITEENFKNVRRYVKKSRDCVVNVMEMLGIIDNTTADVLRIAVGDVGLQKNQIEDIFSYFFPQARWRFFPYKNIQTLEEYCQKMLPVSHVIFCGIKTTKDAHVFLIGKRTDHEIVYIDPQMSVVCELKYSECATHIVNANEYYILQGTMSGNAVQKLI